jgi:hypothetical protein
MNARPVFLKLSLAIFIVLLPFLAYQIWDVVEAARLRSRVDALKAAGAPVFLSLPVIGGAELAARYYQAAAALQSNDSYSALPVEERNRTWTALRSGGNWTPTVMAIARLRVEQNREALDFVDRAAALPFGGFRPGTSYNTRTSELVQLAQVCEFRAAVLAADGNGDAAAASLYSEARLMRALDAVSSTPWMSLGPAFTNMTTILSRAKPSPASLDRLSAGLEALDRDDRLKETFIRFRATMLGEVTTPRAPSRQPGAFTAHLTVRSLDALARIIAAADQPWATRVSAINAVGIWPQPTVFALGSRAPAMLAEYTRTIADQMRRIRCARLSVSTVPLDLVDPFSGGRLDRSACRL